MKNKKISWGLTILVLACAGLVFIGQNFPAQAQTTQTTSYSEVYNNQYQNWVNGFLTTYTDRKTDTFSDTYDVTTNRHGGSIEYYFLQQEDPSVNSRGAPCGATGLEESLIEYEIHDKQGNLILAASGSSWSNVPGGSIGRIRLHIQRIDTYIASNDDSYSCEVANNIYDYWIEHVFTQTPLPEPDFTLNCAGISPSISQSVVRGATASWSIPYTPSGGFNSSVTFAVTGGTPANSNAAGSTVASSPGTVQLSTTAGTTLGTFSMTVDATAPGVAFNASKHRCTISLTVNAPAPTADIKANGSDGPISIAFNTAATISWSSNNSTSCTVSPSGWTGISGSQSTGNLTASRVYSLSCAGPGGNASDSVTVNVGPTPAPTADIKANGSDGPLSIAYNTAATISWSSTNASSCTVSPSGWTGTSNAGISSGNLTAARTYTATCTGPGGSVNDSVTVNVGPPPSTADIKANGSDGPISIAFNTAATISWSSNNSTSCTVSPSGWTGISGSQSTGNLTANQTYTLNCTGAGGNSSDSVTVNVGSAPDFSLNCAGISPSISQSVTQGATASWSVPVIGTNGFTGAVNLNITSGAPTPSTIVAGSATFTGSPNPENRSGSVRVQTSGTTPTGTYSAMVVTASRTGFTSKTCTLPPLVVNSYSFSRNPSTMNFGAQQNSSPNPSSQNLTLSNTGTLPLTFTVTKGQSWLSMNGSSSNSLTTASVAAGSSVNVTIQPNTTNLAIQTHSDTLNITARDSGGNPQGTPMSVAVSYVVGSVPPSPSFTLNCAGISPSISQSVTQGGTASWSVPVIGNNGFNGIVNLNITLNAPPNSTAIAGSATFTGSPNPENRSGSVGIQTTASTPANTYSTMVVTATRIGFPSQTCTLPPLVVNAPAVNATATLLCSPTGTSGTYGNGPCTVPTGSSGWLSWSSTNATANCTISPVILNYPTGTVPNTHAGTPTNPLSATTTFTLTCPSSSGGAAGVDTVQFAMAAGTPNVTNSSKAIVSSQSGSTTQNFTVTPCQPQTISSSSQLFKDGDILTFRIHICNTGNADLDADYSVTDTLGNLVKPAAGWQAVYECGNGCEEDGSSGLVDESLYASQSKIRFTFTRKPGSSPTRLLSAGNGVWSVTFKAQLKAPAPATEPYYRFVNCANDLVISPNPGISTNAPALCLPPYPFVRSGSAPDRREVAP